MAFNFMLNVLHVVLIFAIFYRLWVPGLKYGDALVDALLVFGTVSLPQEQKARSVGAIQVATDFMLLAVFLAHFVGGLGRAMRRGARPSASPPSTAWRSVQRPLRP